MEPSAAQAAAVAAQEIGRHATLVEKDVLSHVVQRLPRVPLASRRGHIRTTLFVGVCGFFKR
jgi:hypothetical protein